mmetsp:Transcript_34156/g.109649  ORF Transcript_34156/g.109649 Transcript_34156/m.109649 type:complete len:348 (+) Transcript_34156:944-1987(+)
MAATASRARPSKHARKPSASRRSPRLRHADGPLAAHTAAIDTSTATGIDDVPPTQGQSTSSRYPSAASAAASSKEEWESSESSLESSSESESPSNRNSCANTSSTTSSPRRHRAANAAARSQGDESKDDSAKASSRRRRFAIVFFMLRRLADEVDPIAMGDASSSSIEEILGELAKEAPPMRSPFSPRKKRRRVLSTGRKSWELVFQGIKEARRAAMAKTTTGIVDQCRLAMRHLPLEGEFSSTAPRCTASWWRRRSGRRRRRRLLPGATESPRRASRSPSTRATSPPEPPRRCRRHRPSPTSRAPLRTTTTTIPSWRSSTCEPRRPGASSEPTTKAPREPTKALLP